MAEPSDRTPACSRYARLERRIAELEAQVAQRQRLLQEARRAVKRQAAPFSRNQPKPNPKPPGRSAGHEPAQRAAPPPQAITETLKVPLPYCPECGGPVEDLRTHEQTVTDLPPVQPVTRKYITHSGYCRRCGRRVRSQHPH